MKKSLFTILLTILFIGVYNSAFAAIGFDAQGSVQNINLTNVNITATVTSSQSNLILLMKIFGSKSVSSVTAGGSAMTLLVATTTPTTNSSTWAIYYLVNPPTGSVLTTTTFSGSSNPFFVCWESYYGVNQTTPFDASSSAYNVPISNAGTVSTTMTTLNANDVIASFAADNGGAGPGTINPAPGTGDTTTCGQNTGGLHAGAAYRLIPTAGATSTSWIQGTSTWYGMAAGSMVAAVTASATLPTSNLTIQ